MFEKLIAAALVFVVTVTVVGSPLFATPKSQDKQDETQKLKEKVAKLGVSKKVELTLRQNGSKTKGTITKLDDTGFTVAEKKSGMNLTFSYDELKDIKSEGSATKWFVLGGVAAAVVILGVFGSYCANEGGC